MNDLNSLVKSAVALYQTGASDACADKARAGLVCQPDHYALTMLLGTALGGMDRNTEAVRQFGKATFINPDDPEPLQNLVVCAEKASRPIPVIDPLLRLFKLTGNCNWLRLAYRSSDGESGIAVRVRLCMMMLIDTPADHAALVDLLNCLTLSGRFSRARTAEWLIAAGPGIDHLVFAQKHIVADSDREQIRRGLRSLDGVIARQPTSPVLRITSAAYLENLGQGLQAIRQFRMAAIAAPGLIDVWRQFALFHERASDLGSLAKSLKRANVLSPDDLFVNHLQAVLAERNGQYDEAEKLCLAIVRDTKQSAESSYNHLYTSTLKTLGNVLDRDDRFDEAFCSFSAANDYVARWHRHVLMRAKLHFRHVTEYAEIIPELVSRPVLDSSSIRRLEEVRPIFMIGFPRSGTTLLDQVIDSHPALSVLEEIQTIEPVLTGGRVFGRKLLDAVYGWTSDELLARQEAYMESLDSYLPPERGVQRLDKMPLRTMFIPAIQRVFPGARFVFSIRHPVDSCLSCYMQNFTQNPSMANFLHIDQVFRYHAAIMDIWKACREHLDINYIEIRYEDLVDDTSRERKRVFEFIGVDHNENLKSAHEHARSRRLMTPSFRQVTQPVYKRAVGRWKRYEKHLLPWLDPVRGFAEEFGYEI